MDDSIHDSSMGLGWLPLLTSLLLPLTFLVTYVWSVLLGHVEPDFPYISSTGAYPPESCFFGQMLNIIAALMAWTVWIRHQIILDYCNKCVTKRTIPSRSRYAAYTGYVAAFGVAIVGNFQSSNVGSIHILGAALAFGVGNVYIWFQAALSYALEPNVNSRVISHMRVLCSVACSCMNIVTVVFSGLHTIANEDVVYWTTDKWWKYCRNKWTYHVVATASEWVLAICFCATLLTFVPEFKRASIHGTVVELDRDRRQVRQTSVFPSTETITENIRL